MVPIFRPCSAAKRSRSGRRAIVPSSFMISQITAAGVQPGHARQVAAGLGMAGAHQHAAVLRLQRKDVARLHQVARRCASRATAACMVRARSAAEMPVVTPLAASIDTVNAVPSACRCAPPSAAAAGARSARA